MKLKKHKFKKKKKKKQANLNKYFKLDSIFQIHHSLNHMHGLNKKA
jgi:hypothetical protein